MEDAESVREREGNEGRERDRETKHIWEAEIRSRKERTGGGWEEGIKGRKKKWREGGREGRGRGEREEESGTRKGWQGDRIGYLCAALLLWESIGIE